MNDLASFLVYRSANAGHATEYRGIWFDDLREWRILCTRGPDPELWSTQGWDSKRALLLAFDDSHITYSEDPPGAI